MTRLETYLALVESSIRSRIGSGIYCRCGRTVCSEGGNGRSFHRARVECSTENFLGACGEIWSWRVSGRKWKLRRGNLRKWGRLSRPQTWPATRRGHAHNPMFLQVASSSCQCPSFCRKKINHQPGGKEVSHSKGYQTGGGMRIERRQRSRPQLCAKGRESEDNQVFEAASSRLGVIFFTHREILHFFGGLDL